MRGSIEEYQYLQLSFISHVCSVFGCLMFRTVFPLFAVSFYSLILSCSIMRAVGPFLLVKVLSFPLALYIYASGLMNEIELYEYLPIFLSHCSSSWYQSLDLIHPHFLILLYPFFLPISVNSIHGENQPPKPSLSTRIRWSKQCKCREVRRY